MASRIAIANHCDIPPTRCKIQDLKAGQSNIVNG